MTIRTTYVSIFVVLGGLLAAIVFAMWLASRTHGELVESENRRFKSAMLADELRQSSDDLTRMVRTYAVTGDPIYEEYFHDILAIRNGERARPASYSGIYWDFLIARKQRPGSAGEAVALRELMRPLNFTDGETKLLDEAQRRSD